MKRLCFDGWWLTSLLGLAVLATFSPGFHSWCLLDREALAAGEVWRLWTGHLAHFSANHLLVDAAVLALLAVALLRSGERRFGRLVFLGGAGLGASLLACDASLARYGGLSGLNALLLGRLAVRWIQAGGRPRVLGVILLAVAVGKFSLDSVGLGGTGVALLSAGVVPSQLSHWLGLVWGLALTAPTASARTAASRRECTPAADATRLETSGASWTTGERGDDGAFPSRKPECKLIRPTGCQSDMALRFPPQDAAIHRATS